MLLIVHLVDESPSSFAGKRFELRNIYLVKEPFGSIQKIILDKDLSALEQRVSKTL
jgi:hypothetical protein